VHDANFDTRPNASKQRVACWVRHCHTCLKGGCLVLASAGVNNLLCLPACLGTSFAATRYRGVQF
jgi:hypothetical protein